MFGDDDNDLVDDIPEGQAPEGEEGEELELETPEGDDPEPEPPRQRAEAPLPSKKKPANGREVAGPNVQPVTGKPVPLAAFLEEKRKFTEALDAERARTAKLEADLAALKNPPKAPPKFTEDPEGFIDHKTKESAKTILEKLEEHGKQLGEVTKTNTQTAEEREEQRFLDDLSRTGEVFSQQHDDYLQALGHVRQIAYRQMKVYHPDAPDEKIMQAIAKQEIALAKQAVQLGRDPHEMAYALALANGYTKRAAAPANKKNSKPPAQRVAPPVDDDGEEVIEPDLTLGRSNGETTDEDTDETIPDPDTVDPFEEAMKETFSRRRRA